MATLDTPCKKSLLLRKKKGGFEEAKPEQAKEKLRWHWQGALDEAIESLRFEGEGDYGNDISLSYSLKIDTPESFIFFTTNVSTLISVEGDKAISRSLNYKISFS